MFLIVLNCSKQMWTNADVVILGVNPTQARTAIALLVWSTIWVTMVPSQIVGLEQDLWGLYGFHTWLEWCIYLTIPAHPVSMNAIETQMTGLVLVGNCVHTWECMAIPGSKVTQSYGSIKNGLCTKTKQLKIVDCLQVKKNSISRRLIPF